MLFGCTECVLSHVLRVVLLGMSFAGDVRSWDRDVICVQICDFEAGLTMSHRSEGERKKV